MTPEQYQQEAARTMNTKPLNLTPEQEQIWVCATGLADEAIECLWLDWHETLLVELVCAAGKVLGLVKKGLAQGHALDVEQVEHWLYETVLAARRIAARDGLRYDRMNDELGGVMWYAANLASALGVNLGELMPEYSGSLLVVMGGNVAKLQGRFPNGFAPEASVARVDVQP